MSATVEQNRFESQLVRHGLICTDDERFAILSRDNLVGSDHVRWLDLHPGAAPAEAFAEVAAQCGPQLTERMVACLLAGAGNDRDCAQYESGNVRLVRAFAASPVSPSPGKVVGQLALQPVSLLAGDGWLLTCWHEPRRFDGDVYVSAADCGVQAREACVAAVERRWTKDALGSTAADLGVLILHELVLSYSGAHRAIADWLEAWEMELYRRADGDGLIDEQMLDRAPLYQLWNLMTVLRDWIKPLNRVGTRDDIDRAWFRGANEHNEVECVDERIDRALRNVADLAAVLRQSIGLQQSHRAERARQRKEDRQRTIEYIAAVFLVPSLVVGFYGANTKLPGRDSWAGFGEMLSALIVLTAFAVLALRYLNERRNA